MMEEKELKSLEDDIAASEMKYKRYKALMYEVELINPVIEKLTAVRAHVEVKVSMGVKSVNLYCPLTKYEINLNLDDVDLEFIDDFIFMLTGYRDRLIARM